MKFDIVLADPPWPAADMLKMSNVKRGASSQYSVMTISDIKNLKVSEISANDSVLILWVPSWLLQEGLDVMKAWGFKQKQIFVWGKIKKDPLESLKKSLRKKSVKKMISIDDVFKYLDSFSFNDIFSFYMGRLFRQCHEIVLVGTRGKPYSKLKNRSQRSVLLDINSKHSSKPDGLQERLELMFPSAQKCELFARRDRNGWECKGNECPSSFGENITDSIEELIKK